MAEEKKKEEKPEMLRVKPEELFPLRIPEVEEKEVVILRLPDGRIVARTREELEEEKKKGE